MAWGMGGWLLFPFLQKIGRAGQRAEATRGGGAEDHLCQPLLEGDLAGRGARPRIAVSQQARDGEKFLINPNKGLAG